jgi:HD-GYP domain-containing protein (c-di-GMP phosphodiesterase class II)
MVVPKQDDKIKALLEGGIYNAMIESKKMILATEFEQDEKTKQQKEKENNFKNIFPDIKEDKFDSSDDEEEKKKNQKLERLGQIAAKEKDDPNEEPPLGDTLSPTNKALHKDAHNDVPKALKIGEEGEIISKYRIPVAEKKVDYNLQLPEDSDSSNFSSDDNNPAKDDKQDGSNAPGE